jgi:hypothetical protein
MNCLLDDVMQCFNSAPFFYGLLVLNLWWPLGLSIVMNVNCFHGETNFLCKVVVSTFVWCPLG